MYGYSHPASVTWRFLGKLSELRKRGNRDNKPPNCEEPGRETTRAQKISLYRQATQANSHPVYLCFPFVEASKSFVQQNEN